MQNTDILVSVVCITYNQAPYIEKCLKQIINQKTDFNFEVIVHDDASNDGTQEIIKDFAKKYPNQIFTVLQKENKYSKGDLMINYYRHLIKGKYIALIEGDDYWPALDKLQKQAFFLENNKEFAGVGGCSRYFDDDNHEVLKKAPIKKYRNKELKEKEFIKNGVFGSNTLMYKKEVLCGKAFIDAHRISPKVGDLLIILRVYDLGRLFIFDEVFEHHRIQTRKNASNYNSIYSFKEQFLHSTYVVNAITTCLEKEHNLKKWYFPKVVTAFYSFRKNKKDFYDCYNQVNQKYKRNIYLLFIYYLPLKIYNKIIYIFNKIRKKVFS